MKRDFEALGGGTFDVLVVGGGIYGAWIACDAAQRGLSVALVERTDWGAGTSSASSKLVHGGLRYLEYFEIGLVRKALQERRRLVELGPHRVWPLRFVLPVYRGARVGRFRFGLGLRLYDFLAGRGQPVPRHRRFGRDGLLESWPFLEGEALRGGFTYGDCGTDDARLVLEIVDGALRAGAVAVNHAPATRLLRVGSRVVGARVRDDCSGRTCDVRAQLVLDVAGPWAEDLLTQEEGRGRYTRLIQGTHLVMPALPCDEAFLLTADDGRVFFLIPWYGQTLLGTTETPHTGDPDEAAVLESETEYLLRNANRALAGVHWERQDVRGSFVGLRTLRNELAENPSAVSREWSLEEPEPGLLLPVGGKLTSARADSVQAVDRIERRLGRSPSASRTGDEPFPWRPEGDFAEWLERVVREAKALGIDDAVARALATRHGARVTEVFARVARDRELGEPIVAGLPFCRAEIDQALEREMALDEADVLRRRIPLELLTQELDDPRRQVAARLSELAVGRA